MVGLQGSGKTTSTAKLARHIVKLGRRPLLVAADPYRPAAADQLETLGKQLDIPVYRAPLGTSVPDIARQGVAAAKRQVRDVVILDTAGRLSVDEALMAEIAAVNAAVKPVETLLVVDAMTGQEAVGVAQAFAAAVPVTGLILTKIDGDARGGAALSISAVTGVPVKFLGTGEKTDALEVFHPDRLAGRILGMGDILTLVERAQETFDVGQAAEDGGEAPQVELHPRRHARTAPAGPEDGPARPDHVDDPGHGQHGRGSPGRRRSRRPQADRGDHPGDDPGGAQRSDPTQRLAPPADRRRFGHEPSGRQPVGQAIRRDAETHEAAFRGWSARGAGQPHGGTALTRRRGDHAMTDFERPVHDPTATTDPDTDTDTTATPVPTTPIGAPPPDAGTFGGTSTAIPARRTNRVRYLAAGLIVALVVAASALAALVLTGSSPAPDVLGYVPDDSVMYGEVRLDFPGDQRQKVGEFLAKFPGFADQAALETKLDEVLDRLFSETTEGQQSFTRDIKPWFDGELGFSMGPLPSGSALEQPEQVAAAEPVPGPRLRQGRGSRPRRGSPTPWPTSGRMAHPRPTTAPN